MPVLRSIRERFAAERPLEGLKVGACLHVTAETANLVRTLVAGGAEVALCAANPLSTQDDVAAVLGRAEMLVRAAHGTDPGARPGASVADVGPDRHARRRRRPAVRCCTRPTRSPDGFLGATEETTTGLLRARALDLRVPVLALNEARTERVFNDHYGTGQSTLDGILRATNILLAGRTVVVLGYGTTGRGIAARARGAGAQVIVCEVDPLRALEARMEGFDVMPALDAAARGDVFITVTGVPSVLGAEHFARMKDGAVLANAGHFDVEIDLPALDAAAADRRRGAAARRAVRPRRPAAEPARRGPRRQPRRRPGPPGRDHGHLLRAARAGRRVAGRAGAGSARACTRSRPTSTARSRGSSSPRSASRSTR